MVKNDIKKQLIPGGTQWLLLRTIQTWRWQSKGPGDRREAKRETFFPIISTAIIQAIKWGQNESAKNNQIRI